MNKQQLGELLKILGILIAATGWIFYLVIANLLCPLDRAINHGVYNIVWRGWIIWYALPVLIGIYLYLKGKKLR